MDNKAYAVSSKTFYSYLKEHKELKRQSDGGLGEIYIDEAGHKVAWRLHGFTTSTFFLYGSPNEETVTFVNDLINKYK